MARKILIALCVLFVMPVFAITGCDEVQENLTPKSSFIADFSCEYRKMNITGKLSASGKKLINISLDSPNTVSGLSVTYKGSDIEISRENMICSADEAYLPESSFPNITKEILYGIAEGRFLRGSAKMCVHTDLIQRSAKPLSAQIQRAV